MGKRRQPMVMAVAARVIEFYNPSWAKIWVQKLGGLSPLSVTDRGESLLIFETLFIAQRGMERGTPARMGQGFGAAEWNPCITHVFQASP